MKPYRPKVDSSNNCTRYVSALIGCAEAKRRPAIGSRVTAPPGSKDPRTLEDVKEISARIEATREAWNPKEK
jgi:hypothetical protein